MNMLHITATLLALLPSCSLASDAAPSCSGGELLASNTVVAIYEQTVDRPCMHMTSLCPDRCDHADKLAVFRVIRNEQYNRPGEYGDDRAEPGSPIHISVLKDQEGQDPSVRPFVAGLQPGDTVRFTVEHRYMDKDGSRYPVRPVTKIEKVAQPSRQ